MGKSPNSIRALERKDCVIYTFGQLQAETRELDGPGRKSYFEALPEPQQREAWRTLRETTEFRRALREPRAVRTDWRAIGDRLRELPATEYVQRIAGREIEDRQRITCPLPDHDDHTSDFGIRQTGWHCFGCNRGGTIYDFAALYWERGEDPKGQMFKAVRTELAEMFGLI